MPSLIPRLFDLLLTSKTESLTLKSIYTLHALSLTSGHSSNPFLSARLITIYSSLSLPHLSTLTFLHSLPSNQHDPFFWNSIIKTHFSNSNFRFSLQLFTQMLSHGAYPDQFTLPMVASSCAELHNIHLGSCIHNISLKLGLFSNSIGTGSSLVYMYSKCNAVCYAVKLFDEIPMKDVISWTAIISGLVRNGESELALVKFKEMLSLSSSGEERERPNCRTMECVLQACVNLGDFFIGSFLHGFLFKIGIEFHPSLKSSLLSLYSKCDMKQDAFKMFDEMPERDLVSWTEIIGICARKGLVFKSTELFQSMFDCKIQPDGVLLSCILMGFANFNHIYGGKAFHGFILKRNFKISSIVGNALISMYNKFELFQLSQKVFETMSQKDIDSWNLIVIGFNKAGCDINCLDHYRKMQLIKSKCLLCYTNSLISVVSSCSKLGQIKLGRSLHGFAIKNGLHENLSIVNSLVGMYAKCAKFNVARILFDHANRDVVTYNTFISSYIQLGRPKDALNLFDEMLEQKVKPNSATLVTVLSACAQMADLNHGKSIHTYIKMMKLDLDVTVNTALVDMYAKCGDLNTARELFDQNHERDIISWNAVISAYSKHGYVQNALDLFNEMERENVRPNEITFLLILSACSYAGLVEEGKKIFNKMGEFSVRPSIKHYSCLVDLLAKSGFLLEAEELVNKMPIKPDGTIWGTLLGACKMYDNVEMGERIAKKVFSLDRENSGYYVLMSNMYGFVGKWDEVEIIRKRMRNRGVRKSVGHSSLDFI